MVDVCPSERLTHALPVQCLTRIVSQLELNRPVGAWLGLRGAFEPAR